MQKIDQATTLNSDQAVGRTLSELRREIEHSPQQFAATHLGLLCARGDIKFQNTGVSNNESGPDKADFDITSNPLLKAYLSNVAERGARNENQVERLAEQLENEFLNNFNQNGGPQIAELFAAEYKLEMINIQNSIARENRNKVDFEITSNTDTRSISKELLVNLLNASGGEYGHHRIELAVCERSPLKSSTYGQFLPEDMQLSTQSLFKEMGIGDEPINNVDKLSSFVIRTVVNNVKNDLIDDSTKGVKTAQYMLLNIAQVNSKNVVEELCADSKMYASEDASKNLVSLVAKFTALADYCNGALNNLQQDLDIDHRSTHYGKSLLFCKSSPDVKSAEPETNKLLLSHFKKEGIISIATGDSERLGESARTMVRYFPEMSAVPTLSEAVTLDGNTKCLLAKLVMNKDASSFLNGLAHDDALKAISSLETVLQNPNDDLAPKLLKRLQTAATSYADVDQLKKEIMNRYQTTLFQDTSNNSFFTVDAIEQVASGQSPLKLGAPAQRELTPQDIDRKPLTLAELHDGVESGKYIPVGLQMARDLINEVRISAASHHIGQSYFLTETPKGRNSNVQIDVGDRLFVRENPISYIPVSEYRGTLLNDWELFAIAHTVKPNGEGTIGFLSLAAIKSFGSSEGVIIKELARNIDQLSTDYVGTKSTRMENLQQTGIEQPGVERTLAPGNEFINTLLERPEFSDKKNIINSIEVGDAIKVRAGKALVLLDDSESLPTSLTRRNTYLACKVSFGDGTIRTGENHTKNLPF